MRVTVFIGAGATLEINGPSTNKITEEVKKLEQIYTDQKDFFIKKVADALDNFFKNDTINFEDIFHALEQISTYQFTWLPKPFIPSKNFHPGFAAFVIPNLKEYFNYGALTMIAKQDIIKKVAELVNEYDKKYFFDNSNEWHTKFWKIFIGKSKLDLATLNYDTVIERIIENYNDGFEVTNHSFKRFNSQKLFFETKDNKLMHLHGCINYGYPITNDINIYSLTDHHEDLYCYPSYEDARQTWFARSTNRSQAGEEALMGPIVTGLYKTDKIQTTPYAYYNAEFINSVNKNNALLIIGYSFGDKHFNKILEKISKIHGSKRKVVLIIWVETDARDSHYLRDFLNTEMVSNISRAFQDYEPFKNATGDDHIISQDGCARLYLDGFKNTVAKYGKDIIDFLTS